MTVFDLLMVTTVLPHLSSHQDSAAVAAAAASLPPAGDQDLICNWLGNRRWVDGLEWSGSQGWISVEDKPWKVAGKQVGEVARYETLSFVKVYQAVSG